MLSTQPDPLLPSCYTLCKYIGMYFFKEGGGGGEPVRRLERQ